jgi:hypothetical protein
MGEERIGVSLASRSIEVVLNVVLAARARPLASVIAQSCPEARALIAAAPEGLVIWGANSALTRRSAVASYNFLFLDSPNNHRFGEVIHDPGLGEACSCLRCQIRVKRKTTAAKLPIQYELGCSLT